MKQTIRLTERELRRMISESVQRALLETQKDWEELESDDTVEVNGQKVPRKFYKEFMKKRNKEAGETMNQYRERMAQKQKEKEARAQKREEKKAAKRADREAAKEQGLSYLDYMDKKKKEQRAQKRKNKKNDTIEKAVAEAIRRTFKRPLY